MGLRGELFSTRVLLQNRTYFFNVKENRMGDLYLNIVESKNRDTGGFDRQSVILFADDLQEFLKGFDESLRVLEKEIRERRRGAKAGAHDSRSGATSGATSNGANSDPRNNTRDHTMGNVRGNPYSDTRSNPRREGKRVTVKRARTESEEFKPHTTRKLTR